jgi:D-alanyl-D-alanine carboxypeptidase (penicillin-binding protein 5/6)
MITTSEHASSMGGSQIFLSVGEQMSVDDLFKSMVITSANDATVALAEKISGSESFFVISMNEECKN